MDRVFLLANMVAISYLSLAPSMVLPAGAVRRVPRCVYEAGRNEGVFRRLKLREAQWAASGCPGRGARTISGA